MGTYYYVVVDVGQRMLDAAATVQHQQLMVIANLIDRNAEPLERLLNDCDVPQNRRTEELITVMRRAIAYAADMSHPPAADQEAPTWQKKLYERNVPHILGWTALRDRGHSAETGIYDVVYTDEGKRILASGAQVGLCKLQKASL